MNIDYIAGLFDGEGSVNVRFHNKSQHFSIRAELSSTYYEIMPMLKKLFGGGINKRKIVGNRKQIWRWIVCSKKCELFLIQIKDRCIIKRKQIELALKLRELVTKNRKPIRGYFKPTKEQREERMDIKRQMMLLNFRGRHVN